MSSDYYALPHGFLRIGFSRWCKLSYGVQEVVLKLAERQNFKCAFCDRRTRLEIEHDHEPEEGPGDSYTIYNIRGLVCRQHNWHLMLYEQKQRGEYLNNWENLPIIRIYEREYDMYIHAYERRVYPLIEDALKARLGLSYWRRKRMLERFDEWLYEGGRPPYWWRNCKKIRNTMIKTPEEFLRKLNAHMQFIVDQFAKDPNYVPPDEFIRLWIILKPFFENVIKPIVVKTRAIEASKGI